MKDLKESFGGDLNGKAPAAMKALLEEESRRQRDRYLCREAYERREYRNGYYERDLVTRFGTLRLRIARGRAFLPAGMRAFQRRAEDVLLLIGEAFLRGISTRQGGRGVVPPCGMTGDPVSAQTVSTIAQSLDRLVKRFHEAHWKDEWAYWFLDGPALRDASAAARRAEAGVPAWRDWWPTGCAGMGNGGGWRFHAVRGRARRPGKGSCESSTGAAWKARTWS